MGEICGDDRFELIDKAKRKLLEDTNIESRPEEIAVLDSVLFRCWQMGWLDRLREGSTEQAISATLGCDRLATGGILSADQVREAWCGHLRRDCLYDPPTPDWQAIADELNTTLGLVKQ